MRQKAQNRIRQLHPSEEKTVTQTKKQPSFFSGFILVFLGSITFSFFFTNGLPIIVGIFAAGPFILIGGKRIAKSSASATKSKLNDS